MGEMEQRREEMSERPGKIVFLGLKNSGSQDQDPKNDFSFSVAVVLATSCRQTAAGFEQARFKMQPR